jgi:mono/diheme cytochrome c family protein
MCRRAAPLPDSGVVLGRTPLVLAAVAAVLASVSCGGDDDGSGGASPEVRQGRQIAGRSGCTACHGADGEGGIGPAWTGSFGSQVELTDGTTVTVDEAYLVRSIADPNAQVVDGYAVSMPENQLGDDEIAKVVAYIRSLDGTPDTETTG